jgi:hypothetical protein
MVLRQSILDRLAKQGTEWFVTVGVPIKEMRNEEYVEKVKALWLGEFMTAHGPIRIHRASVVSEPSGALFYYGTTVTPIDTAALAKPDHPRLGIFHDFGNDPSPPHARFR